MISVSIFGIRLFFYFFLRHCYATKEKHQQCRDKFQKLPKVTTPYGGVKFTYINIIY